MHVCLMCPDLKHIFTTIYVKMNYNHLYYIIQEESLVLTLHVGCDDDA